MIKNQLKSAIRNLSSHKSLTLINLSGFTICLVCLIFITLHIKEEIGYDSFHKDADRTYRIATHHTLAAGKNQKYITTGHMLAEALKEYPEVEYATRLWNDWSNPFSVVYEDMKFTEKHVFLTDSNFFNVFDVEMVKGSAKDALSLKNGLVISEAAAFKYFGDQDPMGKIFTINSSESSGDYIVTGVAKGFPKKSHLHFDFLANTATIEMWWTKRYTTIVLGTYVKLREGTNPDSFSEHLATIVDTKMAPELENWQNRSYEEIIASGFIYELHLQPLKSIHLKSNFVGEFEQNGSIDELRIIGLVGFFILVLAAINYVNLSTANATLRAKEIGIRKVLGSHRKQLVQGFVIESMLTSLISFVIAFGLTIALLVPFNNFSGHEINFAQLVNAKNLLIFGSLSMLFGLVAGIYPSMVLSRLTTQSALKGEGGFRKRSSVRNILVIVQFSVSTFLIIATLVVKDQLTFIQQKRLGFDSDGVIAVNRSMADEEDLKRFSDFAALQPSIKGATVTSHIPRQAMISTPFETIKDNLDTRVQMQLMKADDDYESVMGVELISGRWFDDSFGNDTMSVIINESAANALDIANDPLGQTVHGWLKHPHKVIGVVEDFHSLSLHHEIQPMTLVSIDLPWAVPLISWVMVKAEPGTELSQVLQELEASWAQTVTNRPFEFRFLEDQIQSLYESEQRTAGIFQLFGGLAIFIAVLGLFGLVTFMISRRLKEIGVRKVLGASISNLFRLLSISLSKPIIIAMVLTLPLAIWAMDQWLSAFAYRIMIGISFAVVAALVVSVLTLITITHAIIKAVKTNPVDILRDE